MISLQLKLLKAYKTSDTLTTVYGWTYDDKSLHSASYTIKTKAQKQ